MGGEKIMSDQESGPRHAGQPFAPPPGYGAQARVRQDVALPAPQAMPPAAYGQYAVQPVVAPKSPGIAVVASLFIPGLGSMISGRGGKGALILACYIVACITCLVLVGFVLAPACWIWGMVSGHQDAKRWNAAHGIIS
jgi:TM2 domain-containing membrane protein YozV